MGDEDEKAKLQVHTKISHLLLAMNMILLVLSAWLLFAWKGVVEESWIAPLPSLLGSAMLIPLFFGAALAGVKLMDVKMKQRNLIRSEIVVCVAGGLFLFVASCLLATKINNTTDWKARNRLHLIAATCLGFIDSFGLLIQGSFRIVEARGR